MEQKLLLDGIHNKWVELLKKFLPPAYQNDESFHNLFSQSKEIAKEVFHRFNADPTAWTSLPYLSKIILIQLAIFYSHKMSFEYKTIKAIIENHIVEAISSIEDSDSSYRRQEFKKFYSNQLEVMKIDPINEPTDIIPNMYDKNLLLNDDIDYVKGAVFDTINKSFYLILSNKRKYFNCCEDLSVALQLLFKEKNMDLSFSLDPSDPSHPFEGSMKKVYYPPNMEGTNIGYSFWLADWILKQISQGEEFHDSGRYSMPLTIRNKLPEFNSLLDLWCKEKSSTEEKAARIWVVIKDVKSSQEITRNRISFLIEDVTLGVKAKCIINDITSPTGLKDIDLAGTSADKFANYLTLHMKILESHYPHFRRLRNLAAIIAIVKWLRDDVKLPAAMFNFGAINDSIQRYEDDYPKNQVPRLRAQAISKGELYTHTTTIVGGIDFSIPNLKPSLASTAHSSFVNNISSQIKKEQGTPKSSGYKVSISFIGLLESGKANEEGIIKGYVPHDLKTGKAFGQSGVTVGHGLDLGQRNKTDLQRLKLNPILEAKLENYLEKKKDEAIVYLKSHPLTLTKEEGAEINTKLFNETNRNLEKEYNTNKSPSAPEFNKLTSAQQTVLFSLKHQYGSICGKYTNKEIKQTVLHALNNDWEKFSNQLPKITQQYHTRRVKEKQHLDNHSNKNVVVPEASIILVKSSVFKDPVCKDCKSPVDLGSNMRLPYQVFANKVSCMGVDDNLFCRNHHPYKCGNDSCKSGGICIGEHIKAEGMMFHHDCFCCTGCGGKIHGEYMKVNGKNGMYHSGCAR